MITFLLYEISYVVDEPVMLSLLETDCLDVNPCTSKHMAISIPTDTFA